MLTVTAAPASRVKAAVSKWPGDLETGVRVKCDVGYLCANFGLPVFDLGDICTRQTDVRRQIKASLNAPPIRGGGHNNC